VARPHGAPYQTNFFHCLGCSLMLTEPELFTSAIEFRKQRDENAAVPQEYGPSSGAPAAALDQQALRYRYWHAKAKRERGWWNRRASVSSPLFRPFDKGQICSCPECWRAVVPPFRTAP
jgi:hypothetical protein